MQQRVFKLLDSNPSVADKPDAIRLDGFREAIRYENVSLKYVGDNHALSGIDLTIPRGSVCALVGRSGAGKTSIVNLLLRFYQPTEGRVTIDGHDLADVTKSSLRALIGIVTTANLLQLVAGLD